ncbi:hypothetical protein [Parafrankia sp. EUN1f]|uniref:hypothetical protein n=1 Tax=Parafrankia sp. EUN1f TaxID=102897 RepID=UPI0002EE0B6D|nr:hypothetical protein [Parafrankia sp. EUN1f]
MPTPTARDGGGRGAGNPDYFRHRGVGPTLVDVAVYELLPTPRATDGTHGGPNSRGTAGDPALPAAVQPDRYGRYAPALDRWATILRRPAPDPTEPGRTGRPRLAAPFVEWLMGLPAGWVTATPGLTRNAQLTALGNGVIPQQAAAALTSLLADPPPALIAALERP